LQGTHPIHSIGPKTHVLGRLGPFRYCTKVDAKLNKVASEFFASNATDPLHCTQSRVLGRFGPFSYCTKVDAKLAEPLPLTYKFAKQSRVGIFRNERTRSSPFDSKLKFWSVLDRFITARKSMQNWPNWSHYRTSSLNKVALEFFTTNAPDPLHWTPNSYFGTFRTVSLLYESRSKTSRTVAINSQVY
jgi:hypothetical protein